MFRFTIRDVLWLTAIVAMGCAWWFDHSRLWTVIKVVGRENWHYQAKEQEAERQAKAQSATHFAP